MTKLESSREEGHVVSSPRLVIWALMAQRRPPSAALQGVRASTPSAVERGSQALPSCDFLHPGESWV